MIESIYYNIPPPFLHFRDPSIHAAAEQDPRSSWESLSGQSHHVYQTDRNQTPEAPEFYHPTQHRESMMNNERQESKICEEIKYLKVF